MSTSDKYETTFPQLGADATPGQVFGTIEKVRINLTFDLLVPKRLDSQSIEALLDYLSVANFERCLTGQFSYFAVPTFSPVRDSLELIKEALSRKGVIEDRWTNEPVGQAQVRGAELARQIVFGGDPRSRADYFEALGKPDPATENERVAA